MKKPFQKKKSTTPNQVTRPENIPPIEVNYETGLTTAQVEARVAAGLQNTVTTTLTRSKKHIIWSNILTLFNFINVVLAVLVILAGKPLNALFLSVAIFNTCIGIYQELRAKKAVDQLSIVATAPIAVVRNGQEVEIPPDEIVLDDVIHLKSGDQVSSDGTLIHTEGMELDESLLTGESDTIRKKVGDKVLSGSLVTAGMGYIEVTAVGNSGYAAKLSLEAKKEKRPTSELMRILNKLIGVLTIVIIPIGVMYFYFKSNQLMEKLTISQGYAATLGQVWRSSIVDTATIMIGMIPEGLMLLTSVAFAVGAINLARKKTLVQSMTSIETLARVDTLCLDKTGTITDGTMNVEEVQLLVPEEETKPVEEIMAALLSTLKDTNPTAVALRKKYNKNIPWKEEKIVPFSSKRKWSGATFEEEGTYIMGAPEFILKDNIPEELAGQIQGGAENGFRTLLLAHSSNPFGEEDELPADITPIALFLISDTIRKEAPATFKYFEDQGVTLKVISGDNPLTVSRIAMRAGITGTENYVDMSTIAPGTDMKKLVEENGVFGRVSPYQKRELILALKANGHITCMTGDGVNDVLALKEADCSVAMVDGSSAARSIADFVLLSSDFSNMIEVLKEGRRVINNIEEVASLYLVKTMYSALFAIIYMTIPYSMPYDSRQIGPVNMFTVGIPSFLLALFPNYARPKGRFLSNVMENALPAALTIVVDVLITQAFGIAFGLTDKEIATMCVFFIGMVGFILLFKICKAKNWSAIMESKNWENTLNFKAWRSLVNSKHWKGISYTILLLVALIIFVGFLLSFTNFFYLRYLYSLGTLLSKNMLFYIPLLFASQNLFYMINHGVIWVEGRLSKKNTKTKKLNA